MKKSPFELKIGKPRDIEWNEGSYLDFDQSSAADPRFVHDPFDEDKKPFSYRYLLVAIFVIFGILGGRLVYLQLLHSHEYLALAEGNRLREQKIFAPRGLIYDAYDKPLVRNDASFELVAIPLDLPKEQAVLQEEISKISLMFGVDEKVVTDTVGASDRASFFPVTIKQDVGQKQAIVFLTQAESLPGFSIQNNPLRVYNSGEVFAHLIGYTGKLNAGEFEKLKTAGYLYNDIIGKFGLEDSYEESLRGVFGEKLVEVDARGVVKNTYQQKDPLPGSDLHLYLDSELQKVLYESLQKKTAGAKAKKAAAVAVDPTTGGILAMVSLPGFDNNLFAHGISPQDYNALMTDPEHPLFNRAVSGTYPPGSTVKPLLGAAALAEGVVKETTKIYDGGQLVVPNQFFPDQFHIFRGWKPGGLGNVDIYEAIAMSSDIYFYTVGGGQKTLGIGGLGAERVAKYLKDFYFGQVTGIDLPSEKAGLVPTPDWKFQRFEGNKIDQQWYLGDTYNMSIGQGFVLVTPLQLALATAAIANGGTVYQPRVVSKIVDRDGKEVKSFSPNILNSNFLDPKFIEVSRKGMRQAVTGGTARALSDLPIPIAGKTGTSQFDGSDPLRTHAWFTSFAPYDHPRIALTILIEAGGEGSSAAVPVAREVYDWYAKNRM